MPDLRPAPARESSPMAAEAWDGWLTRQGYDAGFLQSSAWARIDDAVNGTRHRLVVVRDAPGSAAPRAGALLGQSMVRLAPRILVARVARRTVLECHEGPVLPVDD